MKKLGEAMNVLLVEDNPADVFLTEAAFEEAGFCGTLHVARDGEEALQFVRGEGSFQQARRPDLILLDLNLPRLDGFEVLRALKWDDAYRSIPIVVLTTSNAPADIRRAYELHANSYTTKPATLPEFVAFVQSLEQYWARTVRLPSVAS